MFLLLACLAMVACVVTVACLVTVACRVMCIVKKTGWAFKRWLDYLNAQSMFVEYVQACLVTVACLVVCVFKKMGGLLNAGWIILMHSLCLLNMSRFV